MPELASSAWSLHELGEGVASLARSAGLSRRSLELPRLDGSLAERPQALARWLGFAAESLGLEAEPVVTPYAEVEDLLRAAGPAVLRLPGSPPRFLMLKKGGRRLRVLGPDGMLHRLSLEEVAAALRAPVEGEARARIGQMLGRIGLEGDQAERAERALLLEQLGGVQIEGCWLLRLGPGSGFLRRARVAGLGGVAVRMFGLHGISQILMLLGWAMIGRGILQDRLDLGYLLAWALVLLSAIPLRLLQVWLQGKLSIGLGGLLKQRLLAGAMRLEPEEIRHLGAGQLIGRVMESEMVTELALGGGFLLLFGVLELGAAGAVLGFGAGGVVHLAMFCAWAVLVGFLSWRYLRRRRDWTEERLALTHDLVERMVGHRTRLVQQRRERWHSSEDLRLEHYLRSSRQLDGLEALNDSLFSRGWMALGLLGLAPALLVGEAGAASLAVGLGGVLLGSAAFASVATGLSALSGAWLAWEQVRFISKAAARIPPLPSPEQVLAGLAEAQEGADAGDAGEAGDAGAPIVLEASDLVFRYGDRPEPILRGVSLAVAKGERVLLEGRSGSGKSTLASLMVGLRAPTSGLLLLAGLDRHSLGPERWRRWVSAAPQFHENHVMAHTFAFNLLMGRRWPPLEEDMREAEELCHELGLGPLLERMPSGLGQMVGESGWQLSHGEKSRLFLARALLQDARLLILDESFAALDPESLRRCLDCVLRRAPSLLVIAHP